MPGKIFHHATPLATYAWPGGYPVVYYDAQDWDTLCAACATEFRHGGGQLLSDIYWEGPSLECANCGEEIQSAYGDVKEQLPQESEN